MRLGVILEFNPNQKETPKAFPLAPKRHDEGRAILIGKELLVTWKTSRCRK
jgi:hypothetical protein